MPRRKRWKPTLQGTGTLAEALDALETFLPTVAHEWNVHVDGYLRHFACCHAVLKKPDRATALIEQIRGASQKSIGWAELAAFLAHSGLPEPATRCAQVAEERLESVPPWEGSSPLHHAPLAAAWSLLGNSARAAELFALAEKGLEHTHNQSSKAGVVLRYHLLAGNNLEGERILGRVGWDSFVSRRYLRVLFRRDPEAGLALLRGPGAGQGDFEDMDIAISRYADAGRFQDAWDVCDVFTRLSVQGARLRLLERMAGAGETDDAIALAHGEVTRLAEWPLDVPAWVAFIVRHRPARIADYRDVMVASRTFARPRYDSDRCYVPLGAIYGQVGEEDHILAIRDEPKHAIVRVRMLGAYCTAAAQAGKPLAAVREAMLSAAAAHSAEAEPRQCLTVALSMAETFHRIDAPEARDAALAEAFAHAKRDKPTDKRFRYESIMKTHLEMGDLMGAHAAWKAMPAGSRKYEVLDLAKPWIEAGHVDDTMELILRTPHKSSGFRHLELLARAVKHVNLTQHAHLAGLMPD